MSVQSTICILREQAIERIFEINELLKSKNYKAIEDTVSEYNSVKWFVDNIEPIQEDLESLSFWTNDMIQEKINECFYRRSQYENYAIFDNQEQIDESGMV